MVSKVMLRSQIDLLYGQIITSHFVRRTAPYASHAGHQSCLTLLYCNRFYISMVQFCKCPVFDYLIYEFTISVIDISHMSDLNAILLEMS